ncbi:YbdK family carboxylate-amine ligase [Microbacterium lushaniae]|nr:YbdK family carboxylate-amine ligase [Microbacterium lushaniae]KAA9155813.1 YbdK family carboxylate-amine ligase [Microbacterium lushaniae]
MRQRPKIPLRTFGVEEEMLLVDADTGVPVPAAAAVIAGTAFENVRSAVVPEMHQEMIEIVGAPHRSLARLQADAAHARATVDRVARTLGTRVAPLAVSPLPAAPHPSPGSRYELIAQRYGITPTQCMTCGLHVHVSIADHAEGVAILDRIRGWLPALRVLSANSPFSAGVDTGYDSYRYELWNLWPSSGPAEVFGDLEAYHSATRELLATGALLDEGMLYSDARLSARFPTVEVRVCDVPLTTATTALLAGLVRGMVAAAADAARRGEPPAAISVNALRLATWDAALRGLGGTLLDPRTRRPAPAAEVVRAMVEFASPGLEAHGDLGFVGVGVERILSEGNAAAWQRGMARGDLRGLVLAAADLGAAPVHDATPAAMAGSR